MIFLMTVLYSVLCFVLGWSACSSSYFIKSTRITAIVMKSSYVFYLTIINKGIEYLYYAHTNRLEALRKNGKSHGHPEYEKLKKDCDTQIQTYKDNAIAYLLSAHPDMFSQFIQFDDWRGSQKFLNEYKYPAIMFSKEKN